MIEFQGYDCKMVEIVPQFVPEIKFVAGAKSKEKCEVEADYARDENREGLSSVKLEDSMVSIYPNTSGTSSTRFGMAAWNCDWMGSRCRLETNSMWGGGSQYYFSPTPPPRDSTRTPPPRDRTRKNLPCFTALKNIISNYLALSRL